jgi:hypothetical protein
MRPGRGCNLDRGICSKRAKTAAIGKNHQGDSQYVQPSLVLKPAKQWLRGKYFQHDDVLAVARQIPTGFVTHVREDRVNARLVFRITDDNFGAAVFVRDTVGGLDLHGLERIAGLISQDSIANEKIVAGIYGNNHRNQGDERDAQESEDLMHTFTILDLSGGLQNRNRG